MTSSEPLIIENTFHVRYAETDAMGIVHHASYIVYFEEGRSNYIRQLGRAYTEFEERGLHLAVSEVQARYIHPVKYDQQITVRCWIIDAKSRMITFGYEIVHAETKQLFVTGTTKHICVTRDGKVARIPQEWLQSFQISSQ